MKKAIVKIITAAVFALTVSAFSAVSASAPETVSVRIAPYYTEFDAMSVYNPYVEYPVITYKDITYFPMTYDLCSYLGLAVGFDAEKGLYITKYDEMSYYYLPEAKPFGGDAVNYGEHYYEAVIPEYHIYVNGIHYNSSKEKYPFLNFRGVTYFPMTYRLAVEELNFDIEFSPESGFFLYKKNYPGYSASAAKITGDYTEITVQNSGETVYTDESGQERHFPYFWWDRYKLHANNDFLEHLGTYSSLAEFSDEYYRVPERVGENENIYSEKISDTQTAVYYKGEKFDSYENITDYFGREYVFDNVTFLYVNTISGMAPAPYTAHCEYVYAKTADGIKKLSWDERNNLTNVFPDGNGGYYLCSDSYSPAYTSRWSTAFASVYHYKPDGSFAEVTVPDTNSVRAYGVYGGKLYVEAIYYGQSKENVGAMPISAVNSGFYEIDCASDTALNLYPYVDGEVFFTPGGGFYCISNCGLRPRIINLRTRILIPVE